MIILTSMHVVFTISREAHYQTMLNWHLRIFGNLLNRITLQTNGPPNICATLFYNDVRKRKTRHRTKTYCHLAIDVQIVKH